MKNWLGIIEQTRIVHRDPQRPHDDYYKERALPNKSLEFVKLIEKGLEQDKICNKIQDVISMTIKKYSFGLSMGNLTVISTKEALVSRCN